jgi:hypothetical protein
MLTERAIDYHEDEKMSREILGLWESPVREGIWGYFGGGTTKITPYLPLAPAVSNFCG